MTPVTLAAGRLMQQLAQHGWPWSEPLGHPRDPSRVSAPHYKMGTTSSSLTLDSGMTCKTIWRGTGRSVAGECCGLAPL